MAPILIVDDDEMLCQVLSEKIKRLGHDTKCVNNLKSAHLELLENDFDVVFLDIDLPDGNGLDALPEIKTANSQPEVIIITGVGNLQSAEMAIKNGVWDYIQKGSSTDTLLFPLSRALQFHQEKIRNLNKVSLKREEIIGNSLSLNSCLDSVAIAAGSDSNVLITGETGTGKELFAKAIHFNSMREDENFIIVDCASLPESLIESMLFGHEKGSFTGANTSKVGLIKQADKGTLFLDEIGELPMELQKAFLRVLQERRFRPIGSQKELSSEFRLIAATNKNLSTMSDEGDFREDLLFRINSFHIELPPLRERKEDIKKIVLNHIARLCENHQMEIKGISTDFFETLLEYNWPGNVRELINGLDHAFAIARDNPTLYSIHLPSTIRIHNTKNTLQSNQEHSDGCTNNTSKFPSIDEILPLKEYKDEIEKEYLIYLLSKTENDINKVCHISGLSRSHLYKLIKKYDI